MAESDQFFGKSGNAEIKNSNLTLSAPAKRVNLTLAAAGGYYGHMRKASVSDLKNQISRYLDYVKHGETVLVLDRRVPVAELKPVTVTSSSGKIVALERKGIIRAGTGKISTKFFKGKLSGKSARVLDALLEERERGR